MSECTQYQELISRMLDGELSDAEKERLHAHVDECPDCRRVLDAFTMLRDTITEDLEEPPASLAEAVMEQIRREPVPISKRRRPRIGRYIALAACLAIVVFAASRFDLFKGKGAQTASEAVQAPFLTDNKAAVAGGAAPSAALADALADAGEAEKETVFYDAASDGTEANAAEPQPTAEPESYACSEEAQFDAPQTLEYEGRTYYLTARVNALPSPDENVPQAAAAYSETGNDAPQARGEDSDDAHAPVCIDGLLYLRLDDDLWAVYALP